MTRGGMPFAGRYTYLNGACLGQQRVVLRAFCSTTGRREDPIAWWDEEKRKGVAMRVTNVGVKGLFGVFDHEIPLLNTDRVTIILGPNGFGKTMILRMIAALVKNDISIFEHTPFAEFSLTLDDGTVTIIRRSTAPQSRLARPRVKLEFLVRDATGRTRETPASPVPADVPAAVLDDVDHLVPGPYSRRGSGWMDNENKRYSLAEILEKFPRAAAALPVEYRPAIFSALKTLNVFFVQTDRLGAEQSAEARDEREVNFARMYVPRISVEPPTEPRPRVEQYSRDVVERVRSVWADYAKHSQESDRTFPERLVRFKREKSRPLPERVILDKMAELENKRRRLIALGLLDSEKVLRDLSEDDVRGVPEALSIYVEDVQQKLTVFDDMAQRIGSLVDIVNGRFQYKRLSIDRQRGFRVLSESNDSIALQDLSSGEQHELVVLYELLFRAPRNGLVLVDEPEISLHVAWQSRFLSDLIQILNLTDAYAIVATHSPMIIGTRWDLTVELKGPPTPGGGPSDNAT